MENCVFCSIVSGKIPVAKIWEDEKFLAFLDNRPNTPGMTLVIPKQHYDSYIFNLEDDFFLINPGKTGKTLQQFTKDRINIAYLGLKNEINISNL